MDTIVACATEVTGTARKPHVRRRAKSAGVCTTSRLTKSNTTWREKGATTTWSGWVLVSINRLCGGSGGSGSGPIRSGETVHHRGNVGSYLVEKQYTFTFRLKAKANGLCMCSHDYLVAIEQYQIEFFHIPTILVRWNWMVISYINNYYKIV